MSGLANQARSLHSATIERVIPRRMSMIMPSLVDDSAGSEAGNEPKNDPRGPRHPDLQQLRESSSPKGCRASRDGLTEYLRLKAGSVRWRTLAEITSALTDHRGTVICAPKHRLRQLQARILGERNSRLARSVATAPSRGAGSWT